jgi:hypothetical protein
MSSKSGKSVLSKVEEVIVGVIDSPDEVYPAAIALKIDKLYADKVCTFFSCLICERKECRGCEIFHRLGDVRSEQ